MADFDHNAAVRMIAEALRGPVADIFKSLIPSLSEVSGTEFYDTALGNTDLLNACLAVFRKNRELFAAVLVDAKGRPVNDDFLPLKCGRSLNDIISMIVRTHAKRHFSAVLGGNASDPKSKAGRMYQAINEYLVHEWQVSLVPQYAPMPVDKVRELGPKLLELRDPDSLAKAVGMPLPAPAAQEPHPLTAQFHAYNDAQDPAATVPEHPEEKFWWQALNDPEVMAVLGLRREQEIREVAALVSTVGEHARAELFLPLGLSPTQAAVCLTTCIRAMSRAGFTQVFGQPGEPLEVRQIAERMRARGLGARSDLKSLARFVEGAVRFDARTGKIVVMG